MSIRVLDPVGRVCRPLPSKKAKREIARNQAIWLHAEGVEPNQGKGTLILLRQLRQQPAERAMTQLINGDGQFLAWIWPETANAYIRRELIILVGECSSSGPRAVMIPHCVTPEVIKMIRHTESLGIVIGVDQRAAMRTMIEEALTNFSDGDVIKMMEGKLKSLFGKSAQVEVGLNELRAARRQLAAIELALAPDWAKIRNRLVELTMPGS